MAATKSTQKPQVTVADDGTVKIVVNAGQTIKVEIEARPEPK